MSELADLIARKAIFPVFACRHSRAGGFAYVKPCLDIWRSHRAGLKARRDAYRQGQHLISACTAWTPTLLRRRDTNSVALNDRQT
ncbi:hypothetical protein BHMPCIPO_06270 [Ensifer sesbaniae]|nr:hypothetical protein [Ensifer sesbaniae]